MRKKKERMQTVDFIVSSDDIARNCYFCGKQVVGKRGKVTPCPHLMFVATSEGGAEYIAPAVKPYLEGKIGPYFGEVDYEDLHNLPFSNSILILESIGAPSFLEFYIGFTPLPIKREKKKI